MLDAPDGTEILLAAVSDGAGTADRSDVGATIAVEHFIEFFENEITKNKGLANIDRALAEQWFVSVRASIQARADADDSDVQNYACTFLGVILGAEIAASLQIGDGAIVVSTEEHGQYSWVFWPQHGEYANSTYFLTQDNAIAAFQFETGRAVDEVALFSDGIERLVLNMATKQVHSPFFQPIFGWLSGSLPDRSNAISEGLSAYLNSDHINNRTDDDKTLVMATRSTPRPKA